MNNNFSYNHYSDKVIWIDIDSPRNVQFFLPIIKSLVRIGFDVKISARSNSQIVLLADLFHLEYKTVGRQYGKNSLFNLFGTLYTALQLMVFAKKSKPLIALSYKSNPQMISAHILRITTVIFLDNECIKTIPFVRPALIFLPRILATKKCGSKKTKIFAYSGIREDIYIPNFKSDESIVDYLGMTENTINIVLRPAAHEAIDSKNKSEKLFDKMIEFITERPRTRTIILARNNDQKKHILKKYETLFKANRLFMPDDMVDGLNLIWHSDLVISGSRTINREAAALGVPVYSIFRDEMDDLENYLIRNGRIKLIEKEQDRFDKIILEKREIKNFTNNLNSLALQTVINELKSLIKVMKNIPEQNEIYSYNQKQLSTNERKHNSIA